MSLPINPAPPRKMTRTDDEKSALALMEEAFALVRANPLLLVWHWIGSAPFVIALLYFWADMLWSADPAERVGSGSLTLAALFIWMKLWQVEFMRRARETITGAPAGLVEPWTARRFATALSIQTLVQPAPWLVLAALVFGVSPAMKIGAEMGATAAMVFIPMVLALGLCLGWVYGFFQALLVEGDGRGPGLRRAVSTAAGQVLLWPKQTYALGSLTLFFGLFVFANWAALIGMTPKLVKMFTGESIAYSDSGFAMLNATLFASGFAMTTLSLDPILKLCFALRLFYVDSVRSGGDLTRELRLIRMQEGAAQEGGRADFGRGAAGRKGAARAGALLLALAALGASPRVLHAQASGAAARGAREISKEVIRPGELGDSIRETMRERQFAWRAPVDADGDDLPDNALLRFFKSVMTKINEWLKSVVAWIKEWVDRRRAHQPTGESGSWGLGGTQVGLYAVVAVAGVVIALFVYRTLRAKRETLIVVQAEATPVAADLLKEEVDAASFPEDEWLALARRLAGEDPRLAMRAVYLSILSGLGAVGVIRLARHKTNRDYQREVTARTASASGAPGELARLFGGRARAFERAWYGAHEVGPDDLGAAIQECERIRTLGSRT